MGDWVGRKRNRMNLNVMIHVDIINSNENESLNDGRMLVVFGCLDFSKRFVVTHMFGLPCLTLLSFALRII